MPTEDHRTTVKLLVGVGRPIEVIALAITNPYTQKPIGPRLLKRLFKHEIEVGQAEVDAVAAVSLVALMKKGNVAATVWFTKNRWGWRDHPESTKAGNDDYAGGPRTIRVIVEGGLPQGSTPEKPEGDNYSDVPEEQPSWAAPLPGTKPKCHDV